MSPAAILRRHPHLIVTAITPFGLDGPWRDRPATEFTLQAWSGGMMGIGRGSQDRAPIFVGGQVGDWVAGAYASAAAMVSRAARLGTGTGELIDLSMLEAQILCLTYYPVTFFEMLGRPWRTERRPTVPGVATAADGLVALGCGTAQQWHDLCAMSGHQEWIDEDTTLTITEQANLHADELYEWLKGEKVDDIRELASAFRIPNAPVGNGENVTAMDHFVERGSFVTNPRDGFTQPAHPYRLQPATLRAPEPAPRLGEHTEAYRSAPARPRPKPGPSRPGSVAVQRVTRPRYDDVLGRPVVHARPGAARCGTDPPGVHAASRRHPADRGIPASVEQWWEQSPIFSGLNTNKKSLTLDFQTERDATCCAG